LQGAGAFEALQFFEVGYEPFEQKETENALYITRSAGYLFFAA
jgi:hypothetical protein